MSTLATTCRSQGFTQIFKVAIVPAAILEDEKTLVTRCMLRALNILADQLNTTWTESVDQTNQKSDCKGQKKNPKVQTRKLPTLLKHLPIFFSLSGSDFQWVGLTLGLDVAIQGNPPSLPPFPLLIRNFVSDWSFDKPKWKSSSESN